MHQSASCWLFCLTNPIINLANGWVPVHSYCSYCVEAIQPRKWVMLQMRVQLVRLLRRMGWISYCRAHVSAMLPEVHLFDEIEAVWLDCADNWATNKRRLVSGILQILILFFESFECSWASRFKPMLPLVWCHPRLYAICYIILSLYYYIATEFTLNVCHYNSII